MTLPSFPILFLISIAAGFVGSMTGMGGGVVLIPALTLLGFPIKGAIALSMMSVIATSSGAASAYVRDHLTNLKIGMYLEMFTISGALMGASITVAAAPRWLTILFGVALLASWGALFLHRHRARKMTAAPDAFSRWLGLSGDYPDPEMGAQIPYHATRAAWGGGLMLGAGFIAGLLGIGAGALKVLVLDLIMGLPSKVSTTTSNLIIGVTALAGTSVYLAHGLINPGLCAPIILGVLAGAFIGTKLLVKLTNDTVRSLFLIVLLILGVEMIVRGVRGA